MNKKDLRILLTADIVAIVLLIEYLCGLPTVFNILCGWTTLSLLIHIGILRKYAVELNTF